MGLAELVGRFGAPGSGGFTGVSRLLFLSQPAPHLRTRLGGNGSPESEAIGVVAVFKYMDGSLNVLCVLLDVFNFNLFAAFSRPRPRKAAYTLIK